MRRNDVGLVADDDVTKARRRLSGKDLPNIFQAGCVDNEDDVETAWSTLKLPALGARQGMNAQDPLSSVHHYLVCAYILLPACLGIRMCLRCPHCNCDSHDPDLKDLSSCSCQDVLGKNSKPLGGVGGLCEALAMATEFQGDGTPHGHGFCALVNMYQHCSW